MKPRLVAAMLGVVLLLSTQGWAERPKNAEEDAIQKKTEAFVAAFNKGDARTLAGLWTREGDLMDQEGHHIKGRKAIEEALGKYFAQAKGARMLIQITSLRVVKPDLALEDGTSEVVSAHGAPPSAARFTAVYVKEDGDWHLESLREAIAVPPTNSEHLQELAFLVGDWTEDVEKGGSARASYTWASQGNFLVNSFDLTIQDVSVAGGVQWIGWDASIKKARSWAFLFNGGFVEGTWTKEGDVWKVALNATMRDGKKMTATNVITKIDNDHVTLHFIDRSLEGKALPDDKVVKMKRVK
jgi:uncharacterized protein (TIGR02246 family)